MQKLMLAAAAVCALSAALAGRADAGALAGAEGIRPALDSLNVVGSVVCRPGQPHAGTWPPDGCPRGVYHGPDDTIAAASGDRPHFYGWGPGFRVGVGPVGVFGHSNYWGPVYDKGAGWSWPW
jgi:hypothetical protein